MIGRRGQSFGDLREQLGLAVVGFETRDGFIGVSTPPAARALSDHRTAAPLFVSATTSIRVTSLAARVQIIDVLRDPFPAPPTLHPRFDSQRRWTVGDVLSALEERQPRSRRVVREWSADSRAARALEHAIRQASTIAPAVGDEPDDAPPTLDALELATTERAIWPDEPRPAPAPAPLPIETVDAGVFVAPAAWPAVLLELLRTPVGSLGAEREAVHVAAERFEAVGDFRRALIARAALGDDDARRRILAAATAPRVESRPLLAFARDAGPDLADQLAPLVELEQHGRRVDVAAALEAAAIAGDDRRLAELAATVRASLTGPAALAVDIRGESYLLILAATPTLGRAYADVVVPGSLVSRRHLRFRRVEGAAVVEDLGSHNGTEVLGVGRLDRAIAIDREVRLRLGGGVACSIAPHRFGVALEVAGTLRVLTLGPLCLGALTLSASRAAVACTGEGTVDGTPFSGAIDLALGDVVRGADGFELHVRTVLA